MIVATHIIGLTALEHGALHSADAGRCAAALDRIQARYRAIQASGWLIARGHQPDWSDNPVVETGRSFDYDDLAGDDRYVFLDTSDRYVPGALPAACYGWQFDAEQLVAAGAIVGDGDLASEYGDLLWQACVTVAASLPRLPQVSEEDLADFAALLGEHDPAVLAHVRESSTDPTDALYDAVRGMLAAVELPASALDAARTLARSQLHEVQMRRRRTGRAALKLLRSSQHCEVLVPERLALELAVARIEAGVVL